MTHEGRVQGINAWDRCTLEPSILSHRRPHSIQHKFDFWGFLAQSFLFVYKSRQMFLVSIQNGFDTNW